MKVSWYHPTLVHSIHQLPDSAPRYPCYNQPPSLLPPVMPSLVVSHQSFPALASEIHEKCKANCNCKATMLQTSNKTYQLCQLSHSKKFTGKLPPLPSFIPKSLPGSILFPPFFTKLLAPELQLRQAEPALHQEHHQHGCGRHFLFPLLRRTGHHKSLTAQGLQWDLPSNGWRR